MNFIPGKRRPTGSSSAVAMTAMSTLERKEAALERRKPSVKDYLVPVFGAILAVIISVVGAAGISAIHDLTDQVRVLGSKFSALEARQEDDRMAKQQMQNDIKDIQKAQYGLHDLLVTTPRRTAK